MVRILSRAGVAVGVGLGLGLGLGLGACSIPQTAFQPSADAGGAGDDGMTSVLSIRPSVASFDVDEGSTTSFTVKLNQAPSAELVVKVAPADSVAAAKLGVSVPELRFEPTNFDQPQSITVTGLVDVNAVDELVRIALTADGVDPVTVNATVRDHDKVDIATDIVGNAFSVGEAQVHGVKVHLTHQPAGDVRVKVVLGAGPVFVAPAEVTFTAANYDVDQTFTFTAPDDVNIISEDESLTFQAAGSSDKLYTIHDVDKDTLNISVTTPNNTSLAVPEGGFVQISVALTKQPAANTTVHLDLQSGNVSVDHTDLTFTPQNFDQAQAVKVSAAQDLNTSNESDQITLSIPALPGVGSVSISARTIDDDVQAILEDAPDPLSVTENQMVSFGVTLKFQPSANLTVSVNSLATGVATASPGTLTFTPQNYNDPTMHRVTVRGSDDNNLATNSTSIKLSEATLVDKLVPIDVADDDTQQLVVSTAALSIPEGMSRTFDVSLKFDPGTTVRVDLADDKPMALPIDRTSITFTTANYSTPVHVTVSPPVDNNAVSETATVTVSGGGAPTPATVMLTASDATVVQDWGWPAPFPSTILVPATTVVAYKVDVGTAGNLDSFHTYVPTPSGRFRMALYTNVGGVPGSFVAEMAAGKVLVTGVNDGPSFTNPLLTSPSYFLVIRFENDVNVGRAAVGVTGTQCIRNFGIPNITDPWPNPSFGPVSCTTDRLINIWMTTYHQ